MHNTLDQYRWRDRGILRVATITPQHYWGILLKVQMAAMLVALTASYPRPLLQGFSSGQRPLGGSPTVVVHLDYIGKAPMFRDGNTICTFKWRLCFFSGLDPAIETKNLSHWGERCKQRFTFLPLLEGCLRSHYFLWLKWIESMWLKLKPKCLPTELIDMF